MGLLQPHGRHRGCDGQTALTLERQTKSMDFHTLDDLEVKGKRVLVRADLNVP